jgi:DNA-binding IscR family transcriptional regulator
MICATDDPAHASCVRAGHCTVNLLWVRVRDAICGALDSMTLADLLPPVPRYSSAVSLPVLPAGAAAANPASPPRGAAN